MSPWFPLRMNSQKSLCFFAKNPMNYVMFKPIFIRLKSDPRLKLYLTGKLHGQKSAALLYTLFGIEDNLILSNWQARLKKFTMYLSPDFRLASKRASIKVLLFHGAGFPKFYCSNRVLRFDKLFFLGEYTKEKYISEGILHPQDPRIELIGMPKVDCLVDGSLNKAEIMERLNLDPSLPTLIYAPTWGILSSLYSMGLALIEELSKLDVNLLIKLHTDSLDPRKNPIDWVQAISPLEKNLKVRLIKDYDSSPYLFVSDVLISDASAIIYEFCLLDRPIILLDVPELLKECSNSDLHTFSKDIGFKVQSVAELKEAICYCLGNPQEKSALRQEVAKKMFYNPGTAAQRAVDKIYQLLDLEPLEGD